MDKERIKKKKVMDSDTKDLLKKQFEKLPVDVQRAIQSSHLHEQIEAIGKKHQLHIDQIGQLEEETVFVMLGFSDPADFVAHLTANLHLDVKKAEEIANDVGQKIMFPIRDSMRKFMEEEAKKETGQTAKDVPAITQSLPEIPTKETSVVMPSAAKAEITPPPKATPALAVTASPPKPAAPAPATPAPAAAAPPSKQLEMHAADLMLSEPTVSLAPKPAAPAAPAQPAAPPNVPTAPVPTAPAAKVEAPKPAPYKADPYREPPE